MSAVDSGTMLSGSSNTSRESGEDIGATAVLASTTSPASLGPSTSERNNNEMLCLLERKDLPWERFASGMRHHLVLAISSSTVSLSKNMKNQD